MRYGAANLDLVVFFFFKQKTAYELVRSDWSSDVCSSDLARSSCRRWRASWAAYDTPNSPGNSASPESTAKGAACPRPQSEATWMTSLSDRTAAWSTGASSIARSRAVPSRHGVHLPHDS